MPPSPALRYSPGREQRADNHKRGRSLEGGLLFKEKDEDLALFSEMQTKERENFLLQSTDDFDDTFSSKLRYFSDLKLGISIPARGESSELLNAEGEKNDYDWLLTPPDTPLFPSLDDEPPPVAVPSRGRTRSQPITISRSSTMEKSYRSSRGSASPNRLSPSPRSGSSTFQSRGRPSSSHSSPPASHRPATPPRRPSPPPSKPSTPAPRSLTPTPRRMSTGSTARGTSPVRTSRGNSASPKIRAWQSNIPGFSSEAPPNLRTSLADRPASYVRGSSPASRNGRDKFGRQSMSPTASRSVSSSHSQERDRISSHSKGSVASSGDDDVDSLQSVHVGSLDRLAPKRIGPFPNNRAPQFSKKSGRIMSASSAPKKSFDSALRQWDHRKSPQNMFRPLLSSVPSSTFYAGKTSSAHRSLMSRNSSVTTSSNTSSDHGTIVVPDTEGSVHQRDDVATESGKVAYADVQEEVFAFDKVDAFGMEFGHDRDKGMLQIQLGNFDRDPTVEHEPAESEEFTNPDGDMEISSASNIMYVGADLSEVDSLENTKVCHKCGQRYRAIETVEMYFNLCPDCIDQNSVVPATSLEATVEHAVNFPVVSSTISETENRPSCEPEPLMDAPESLSQTRMVETAESSYEDRVKQSQSLVGEGEQRVGQHETGQSFIDHSLLDEDAKGLQLLHSDDHHDLKAGISEGAGISVLLKRSSSNKGPFVQGRTFVASTISYDDLSYTRTSVNSLRSSIGHGSTSASSSVDFSSVKQLEARVQRQLSGKKSDMENYRYDQNTRLQRTGSSLSGSFIETHQASGLASSSPEETIEDFGSGKKYDGVEEATISSDAAVANECLFERSESSRTMDASTCDFPCNEVDIQLEEKSAVSNHDNISLNGNEHDLVNRTISASDVKALDIPPDLSFEAEHTMQNSSLDGLDGDEEPSHRRLASISEIEVDNPCQSTLELEKDDVSTNLKSTTTDVQDPSISTPPEKEVAHDHGIIEESTVMVECRGGSKGRSLTLEEATDTILFCSSIVHDLAYQAATIAIEKENPVPLETSRPTVTILGKSTADRKDPRGRPIGKRASKSMKVRQRRVETDVKSPSSKTENDENVDESMVRNVGLPKEMDSMKPPKLESKCNCTIM
ncbi:hypothetical protein Tsubulata_016850 [Turnera subulata]|uniref:Uncharacterized protein n=1 Tax=Turnera subulata TaxID=218843 RepID=A0A9Q0FXJ5_9ROSI|nr:hypothetical protein Tsubulata_016850 [Turnera subulata]